MTEAVKKKAKKDKIPRVLMPEQEANVRNKNFIEVPTGYTPEMAVLEAQRCLQCKKTQLCGRLPCGSRYSRLYPAHKGRKIYGIHPQHLV
jgi:hypothetical protein